MQIWSLATVLNTAAFNENCLGQFMIAGPFDAQFQIFAEPVCQAHFRRQ